MKNNLDHLITAYIALLSIPVNNEWRMFNPHVLASIRDRIAEITKQDAEHIQSTFEALVEIEKHKE